MTTDEKIDRLTSIVEQGFEKLNNRMDALEGRMDRLEARVGDLEKRIDNLETRVNDLERQVKGLSEKVTDIHLELKTEIDMVYKELQQTNTRLAAVENRMDSLEDRFWKVDLALGGAALKIEEHNDQIKKIELLIENRIEERIMAIGDGYKLLMDKINDSFPEKETLLCYQLKVDNLEQRVDKLENKKAKEACAV